VSTEYEIRCADHEARWPEGGVYGYNRANLQVIIDYPDPFIWFAGHQDFTVSLLGAYGDKYLCEWVRDHKHCRLGVFNEYGDPAPNA
jgi:hypothetical protein